MELPKGSTRASRVVFGALAKDMRRRGIDAVFGEGALDRYGFPKLRLQISWNPPAATGEDGLKIES